ncbi:MAG TPA: hypothetical protein PLQ00_15470, partial [Thermoguttaceae bacterium]|nr:hypothetical protein [Thermoguttaceae bacterium]
REATLNLIAIRHLGAPEEDDRVLKLRRYILGLALVAFTAPPETSLREGCQLVPDSQKPTTWELVSQDGKRSPWNATHQEVLAYAQLAAQDFGVGQNRSATFNAQTAKDALVLSKAERKATRRRSQSATEEGGSQS